MAAGVAGSARVAGFTATVRPALYFSMDRRTAQPVSRTTRLSPALARTWRPGSSTVPLALRVMFLTLSVPIVSAFLLTYSNT